MGSGSSLESAKRKPPSPVTSRWSGLAYHNYPEVWSDRYSDRYPDRYPDRYLQHVQAVVYIAKHCTRSLQTSGQWSCY